MSKRVVSDWCEAEQQLASAEIKLIGYELRGQTAPAPLLDDIELLERRSRALWERAQAAMADPMSSSWAELSNQPGGDLPEFERSRASPHPQGGPRVAKEGTEGRTALPQPEA